jgi:signal transduction histidine kinase
MMKLSMQMEHRSNVLLVDDQPAKILSYRAILEGLDANLVSAHSAREALDCLLRTEFAAVLVDVIMPELDGFELAKMIRDHPRFKNTAIIFVSGVALTELDRLRGYECGAVDYLPVPVVPEILRAKVTAFVELHRKTRELADLNRDLEERVAERTAQLEEANHRKDEFLALLAHELRNPLAAIRTAAELVQRTDAPPNILEQASAVIRRQVTHLGRLVDDLVDVSRITRGLIELQRDRLKVGSIVFHAIETSQPLVAERGHTLSISPIDDDLEVSGDLARLTQVVANILHNAAKFTAKGGRIALSVERDGGQVVIRVRDNGAGITQDELPHVFQLFSQTDRRLERNTTGLGVGLALVRRLVEMHGGTVAANSEGAGRGTELIVRLPLLEPEHQTTPAEAPATSTAAAPSRRILVVDDNADAAEALALLLRLSGHEVETAFDGVEALRVAPAFSPDIVLLDLGMPRLDGYDTARSIRAEPWGKDVTLVAVTGWGQPKDRDRTLEAGFNAHLVKPVVTEELMRVIRV